MANGDQLSEKQKRWSDQQRDFIKIIESLTKIGDFSLCKKKKWTNESGMEKLCKLQNAEFEREKYQWHSWANEIKINCEIIYLSVNWVELARENNVRALFKHHFLSSVSPVSTFYSLEIIQSEFLLIFMNANWSFLHPITALAQITRAIWTIAVDDFLFKT